MYQHCVISAQYSQKQAIIRNHFHDGYQLIYVVRGSARVTVSGKEYDAKAGTLVLIGRLESHKITGESADYSRYTVQIGPEIVNYSGLLGENLFSLLTNRPEQFRHAVDMGNAIAPILEQMAAESRKEDPLQQEMLVFLLCQLLVLCYRTYPELLPENTRNLKLAQQMQRYIEEHVATKLTLAELAQQFNMSQSYLSHLFKDTTGCSVMSYLNAYRFLLAKRYLVETDWDIGKIVESCGFSDNSNFSRTFKQTAGLSPSQFRKKYKV